MKRNFLILALFGAIFSFGAVDSYAAVQTRAAVTPRVATPRVTTQSAIQKGTKVRTKVVPTGLYSEECYNYYYSCMDQFCISDNVDGGSCACSDENQNLETKLEDIKEQLTNADKIGTLEVEKIKAGARADIIFDGTRQYDERGNVISLGEKTETQKKEEKRRDLMSMFETSIYDEDLFEEAETLATISQNQGAALYSSANNICATQMPEACKKDLALLTQVYSMQIKSDCKGFENSVAAAQVKANVELAIAQSRVRDALKDSFEAANKFDRGTCMVEFRKCMQKDDACKSDWSNCVSIMASENMQEKTTSTAKAKVKRVVRFDIADSTLEILDSKRNFCENVLDQCVAVRDYIWDDFLREAAPTIYAAELALESKMRQSCLTDISDCIQVACKDDIVGTGTATMDACLSRPDMARSFCKVEVDRCETMEPLIWGYVVDKLAAMRIDVCTQEVKDCFTSPDRCGPDFGNCIGMDYKYIHDICPLDKLVVCKKNNPDFSMNDLDSMLMGLYLNIDNSALDVCQNRLDKKMAEVCGSTTDCDVFATDDTIGTGSLRPQKDGTIYRVTGMISFGSIKMGEPFNVITDKSNKKTVELTAGQIGTGDYLKTIKEKNMSVANAEGIVSSIEEELNNITGKINKTIAMIEMDPQLQYCTTGRNLEQITGANTLVKGRFPHMLDQIKMQIALSALNQATENYNEKLTHEIAAATKNASTDLAQYMCQKMAEHGGSGVGVTSADTPLAPPYAISYEVGAGLSTEELTKGGAGVLSAGGITVRTDGSGGDGGNSGSGMIKETTAMFSRDTRTCHLCTTITTQSCTSKKSPGLFGRKKTSSCETNVLDPKCEDIVM